MNKIDCKAKILEVAEREDIKTIVVEFNRLPLVPIAPGGLYLAPRTGESVCEFHKEIKRKGLVITFETYDNEQPLPRIGEEYFYYGWWTLQAMDAFLDINANWEKRIYPDNGDHHHCLFQWETISSYTGEREGYYSEERGWITIESYNNYIKNDIYRLRK